MTPELQPNPQAFDVKLFAEKLELYLIECNIFGEDYSDTAEFVDDFKKLFELLEENQDIVITQDARTEIAQIIMNNPSGIKSGHLINQTHAETLWVH